MSSVDVYLCVRTWDRSSTVWLSLVLQLGDTVLLVSMETFEFSSGAAEVLVLTRVLEWSYSKEELSPVLAEVGIVVTLRLLKFP